MVGPRGGAEGLRGKLEWLLNCDNAQSGRSAFFYWSRACIAALRHRGIVEKS